jgi:phosphoribosylformimino-5-aminoimidazole carboxamide ribotide isomerase
VKQIARKNKKLIVDAGISDLKRAEDVLKCSASKLVIGTETLSSGEFVRDALRSFGKERVIVSLDMMNSKLLGSFGKGPSSTIAILKDFIGMGLAQVVILDLARVGSGQGVNIDFLKQLVGKQNLDVFVGGGVRNITDLVELRELGVQGVLLATALHSGAVTMEDLKNECMEI